uniref:Rho guanine nucleotide exchange factor 17 n=1 Tax=Denticeps clupeoides TaxID=299321 RepID=A0AAY4DDZ4_9TELE
MAEDAAERSVTVYRSVSFKTLESGGRSAALPPPAPDTPAASRRVSKIPAAAAPRKGAPTVRELSERFRARAPAEARDRADSGASDGPVDSGDVVLHAGACRVDSSNWPSVTKIRRLFGDDLKSAGLSDPSEPDGSSWHLGPTWQDTSCSDRDTEASPAAAGTGGVDRHQDAAAHSHGTEPGGCLRRGVLGLCGGSGGEPRTSPPAPPPRSSSVTCPHRARSFACRRQGGEPPPDSLHSWHSSSEPHTAPSAAPSGVLGRQSSGDEENGFAGPASSCFHKNGSRAKHARRSSGSEGDSPATVARGRDPVRRRSLRKKKKNSCSRGDGESDSDDPPVMEHLERYQRSLDQQAGRRTKPGFAGQAWERGVPRHGPSGGQEGFVRFHRGMLDGTSSPVPTVSRVSKVNIPSFLSSPNESKSSSRYSSTETLKEEDHSSGTSSMSGASSSVSSKTYYGNTTMYRSPSFGHGDNFSRTTVHVRPKLIPSLTPGDAVTLSSENRLYHRALSSNKEKNRMSMSNPDIASETMSLLNYLKMDLSELKVRKKRGIGSETVEDGLRSSPATSSVSSIAYRSRGLHHRRPSLKDLTATLRRAKSFTYSEKTPGRLHSPGGAAQRSSSEQRLDRQGDGEGAPGSDREVESDDCRASYGFKEPMAVPLQDHYVQEARQVIRDICKMGAADDDYDYDSFGFGDNGLRRKEETNTKAEEKKEEVDLWTRLSGHESSLTDEGIVTEPEAGPCSAPAGGRDLLGQTLTVWNQSGLYKEELADLALDAVRPAPVPGARAEYEGESRHLNQGPLEAPSTPSAIRRRRKFSSAGNNGSDSSNVSAGDSNGEAAYRSLSDPMPGRSHAAVEEGVKSFSVDSNLLGSLSLTSKAGRPESAASDLSVCSEGLRDFSTVIESIVREPGAMDKVIDERGNGKAVKKKSFSDPSRRGEPAALLQDAPGRPSAEAVPPSSSEPALSEQRDELWELDEERRRAYLPGRKLRSQSERALPSHLHRNGESKPAFPFDPKLAEVLSPHMSRRSSKKRTNRAAQQQQLAGGDPDHLEEHPEEDPASSLPQLPPPRPKHVRHASEPATFVPIAPPNARPVPQPQSLGPAHPSKLGPGDEAPSLEDVTKQYILALNSPEGNAQVPAAATAAVISEGPLSTPATPTNSTEPRVQKKPGEASTPAPLRAKPRVDMRKHVVMTLLDTEQSYVESLRTLIQGYMKPLKQPENSPLCDPSLVDEIFFQIPEILDHHEHFLEQVTGCVNDWHDRQTVGHLLVESFSKEILANIYSAYIDNFLNAKDAVRVAKEAKPAFLKFLEQSMRENKEKQALADLMIKPVQRIPRYELLVKDLLKHTPEDHPDHHFLLDAQKNIKRLAERINKGRRSAEEVERETRVMQEIEAHIEGVEHILNPQRKFLRQEMVMEAKSVGGKKDRSLFLFSDLLICTTLKRKSGSLRRSSMSLYSAASVIDTSSKYKFLWKLPLEDVEMVKGSSNQATNRENIQKTISRLDEDLSTLGQISKLSETLSFPHQSLDDVIKDLMASVHRELAEKQSLAFSMTFLPTKVELTTASAEGTFIFEFNSPEARSNFEQAFEEAKKKLAMNKDQWDPEFLKAIPIMKTRSGMQFSCASPSHSSPENTYEVWVCNSDGYVGQVCLLNIRDEPTVEACIAVCSARIICIAAVPGLKGRSVAALEPPTAAPPAPQQQLHISISGSSLELNEPPATATREPVPFDSDDTDDEDSPSPSSTLQSQASHSTISSSFDDEVVGTKDMATETTSSEEEPEFPVSSSFGGARLNSESPVDGRAMRRSSRGSFTRGSLEDLLSIDPEAYQSSVWLGTEDGCIHVYQSSDNIRNRKNSMKMQHSASILCILYLDNKVFVSLANGEVIVYQREAGSFWDPQNSQTLSLGTPSGPVTKMVPVAGKLWCGCQNRIFIINTTTLAQEHSFQVGQDSNRCVTSMVSYGHGVWIALQGSAQVRLYHASTYESLTEVDVAPAVHKMLAGSDAIIRQHKAACLRITALLACKDLLWIGTSAGVILTLAIPSVTSSTAPGVLRSPLQPMGSAHGHTGHVRFLTSIELPEGFSVNFPTQNETGSGGLQRRDSARQRTSTYLPIKSNLLVISGGDGYEDFRLTNSSETVGRDDSTNHLLLWRV